MKRRSPRKRSKPARLSDPVASAPNRRLTSASKKARKSAAVEKATRCSKKNMTAKAWQAHLKQLRDDKNARRREKRAAAKDEKGAKAPGRASAKKSKASPEEEEEEEEPGPESKSVLAQLSNMVDPEEAADAGDIEGPLRIMEA